MPSRVVAYCNKVILFESGRTKSKVQIISMPTFLSEKKQTKMVKNYNSIFAVNCSNQNFDAVESTLIQIRLLGNSSLCKTGICQTVDTFSTRVRAIKRSGTSVAPP